MIVLFPYLGKVKVSPGWEAFAEHNRYFVRGILIMLIPILLLILLSYIPSRTIGVETRRYIFNGLGFIWIAYGGYFAISNSKRAEKVLCPRCKKRFDGPRWKHDSCQNCGLCAWSPLSNQEVEIKTGR